MSDSDVASLKSACETLNKTVQDFTTKMYQAAQAAGIDPSQMGGAAGGNAGDDEIIG